MAQILIIDDDPQVLNAFTTALQMRGHECDTASTLHDGRKKALEGAYDIVLLDINLPDASGLTAVREISDAQGSPEVIVITGYGGADSAASAIREGAWDYVTKPPSFAELDRGIERALEYRRKKRQGLDASSLDRTGIVGDSAELTSCLDKVAAAASSVANVLITGESGTGKELFAQAIHRNSNRSDQEMVVLDCSALPEHLAESILFGHEKGAFTGAERKQPGLVRQAAHSTLFIDEIGELPLAQQSKFLRVLQERRFRPVGSQTEQESDFRLICATNRDLQQMVKEGTFREDLYFRIKTFHLELPPLRRRKEDIPAIVQTHTEQLCRRYGLPMKEFSSDFIESLLRLSWPGNVRELLHAVELAVVNAGEDAMLFARHLPEEIRIQLVQQSSDLGAGERANDTVDIAAILPTHLQIRSDSGKPHSWSEFKDTVVRDVERSYLEDLLEFTNGNAREAAALAGLGLSRFYELLRRHSIRTK